MSAEYVKNVAPLSVEGRLQYRDFPGEEDNERSVVEIVADDGNPKTQKGRDRLMGYEKALLEYGISVESSLVLMREFDEQSGFDLTLEVLKGTLPDVLFAANMDVQVGMLRALRTAGLRVPNDISLGGIDELPYAAEYSPFEVVAAQQTRTIGVIAAQLLIDKLEGRRQLTDHQVVVLRPQLVRRGRPDANSKTVRTPETV